MTLVTNIGIFAAFVVFFVIPAALDWRTRRADRRRLAAARPDRRSDRTMTDDDIRLAVEETHDSILGWAYEVAHADTLDEEQSRIGLDLIFVSLSTIPPGWHDEWVDRVDARRTYIDRAITLLRVAQHTDPAAAAAALRDYLEETP